MNEVRQRASQLRSIADIYHEAQEMADRLYNCYVELKDISQEIASHIDDVEFDPVKYNETRYYLLVTAEVSCGYCRGTYSQEG